MSKEQLLQEFAAAYERVIQAVTEAAERGTSHQGDTWGSREVVAHLAGWEVMATVRIPAVAAGMPPLEFEDERQNAVMADAINATIATMIGDQSLGALCGLLRRAYQSDLEILKGLNDTFFQPGQYVYERTKGAIEHCQEHIEALGLSPR